MHEIQVEIVCPQILQGLINRSLDILRGVMRVPQFAGEPDVGSGDAAPADAFANLSLVEIDGRTVEAVLRVNA